MPLSRRSFLSGCCSAVTATGLLSALGQLRLLGALAQPASDYKALVCLFLNGGNDANNLIIPYDNAGYAAYAAARAQLALPSGKLLPITPRTTDGRSWGLHPSLGDDFSGTTGTGLKKLFDDGKLALLANVGTLLYPTTKQQYKAGTIPLPPQLYSHNNQQVEWQSSLADKSFSTGWGGRLADLINAFNENPAVSMCISLAGHNSFQVGRLVTQLTVGTSGPVSLTGASTSTSSVAGRRTSAYQEILRNPGTSLFETAFAQLTQDALADSAMLSGVLKGAAPFTTVFPSTNLGQQLSMIARLIAVGPSLGLRRQIFFAQVGGYDLHDDQVSAADTSTGTHANLFSNLSKSLTAFYDATSQLKVADQVTTFTASDFGRTYGTNGRGSDHGWGSHHLLLGGAVRGGDLYGRMPTLTVDGPDDTGRGRWIPSTSVDEYSARLALWFGVSPTDLPLVLPNIGRFNHLRRELNFL